MKTPHQSLSLLAVLTLLITVSCGKKDADKIGEAQTCLDGATAATANACMEKVSGLETPQSYVIRCAATFIAEGFDDPTRLTNAYANMGDAGAGASSSLSAMNVLAFTKGGNATANQTLSNTNFAYCNKSASKGLIMLSGIANMATNVLALGAACTTVDAACMASAKDNAAAQAAVGAAAAAAYTANCANGQTSNQQFCSQFSTAVTASGGTTDTTCLGKQLLYIYSGATAPSC